MYLCNEDITVVHFDKQQQEYICRPLSGVSWYTQKRRTGSDKDSDAVQETKVRIPERLSPDVAPVAVSDIVCRGIISSVQRRSELEQYEHFGVVEVRDNRRGHGLRHWAVIGS